MDNLLENRRPPRKASACDGGSILVHECVDGFYGTSGLSEQRRQVHTRARAAFISWKASTAIQSANGRGDGDDDSAGCDFSSGTKGVSRGDRFDWAQGVKVKIIDPQSSESDEVGALDVFGPRCPYSGGWQGHQKKQWGAPAPQGQVVVTVSVRRQRSLDVIE
jgi:hypothetical protein